MAAPRKVASRGEAEQLLGEWGGDEDGPSLPESCAGRGVDARSLHCCAPPCVGRAVACGERAAHAVRAGGC